MRALINWFRVNFNKYHWRVIKAAITGWPWDEYYYLKINRERFLEMAHYFEVHGIAESGKRNSEYLKLLAKLSDIMMEDVSLYTYVYKTEEGKVVDITECCDKHKIIDNGKYVCKVRVNMSNIDRFVTSKEDKNWLEESPHELYQRKAERLYFMILERHLHEFWD